jgi:predicted enzyme related to lactoylglutathione lyase
MSPARANPVVHLELHTAELDAARAFYGRLLGWRAEEVSRGAGCYAALALGEALSGGMVECATARALWLPYVGVPDISGATEGARALGASVLLEPREGPAGWRSVVRTGCGGELAFWQAKR